jgi:acyl carrier protein
MDGNVEPRVRTIVADLLGLDPAVLSNQVSLRDDLALDSLDLLELVGVLEDEFFVTLPRGLPPWLSTFGDLLELLSLLVPTHTPEAHIVFVPPPGRCVSQLTRCEPLTPYAIETVVDEAKRLGPGASIDITLEYADDIVLARTRAAFAALGAGGVDVQVHLAGPPGARPHPHAA